MIQAQDILLALTVASYPWLKKEEQRRTHQAFHKMAYPKTHSGETLSTEELAQRIKTALQ